MHRLIEKSFSCGADRHFRVVTLDDAIEILQADQFRMNQYVERNIELEHENRKLREEMEQAHSFTLRLIQGYHTLRKIMREHAPHLLEHKRRQS